MKFIYQRWLPFHSFIHLFSVDFGHLAEGAETVEGEEDGQQEEKDQDWAVGRHHRRHPVHGLIHVIEIVVGGVDVTSLGWKLFICSHGQELSQLADSAFDLLFPLIQPSIRSRIAR